MNGIVLFPKTKEDAEAIKKLAERLNISSANFSENDSEFLERKKLAEAAEQWYPQEEISMEEIVSLVKETRAEIYARKHLFGN